MNQVFLKYINDIDNMIIDSNLIIPFKNVLTNVDKYFNSKGYFNAVNYSKMLDEYLVPKVDINKILQSDEFNTFYNKKLEDINKYIKNYNIDYKPLDKDEYLYEYLTKKNIISPLIIKYSDSSYYDGLRNIIKIDNKISNDEIEKDLCRCFLHFISECGKEKYGDIRKDYPSFIIDSFIEKITNKIYPSNSILYSLYIILMRPIAVIYSGFGCGGNSPFANAANRPLYNQENIWQQRNKKRKQSSSAMSADMSPRSGWDNVRHAGNGIRWWRNGFRVRLPR